MPESKTCETCGATFTRPPRYATAKWNGRRYCSKACSEIKTAPRHPCRICGEPTPYKASITTITGLVHCGRPECAAASKALKNERIAAKAVEMYATGARRKLRDGWSGVARVSREESLLRPQLEALGWVPQFRVLTGVHTNTLPRQFHLDFALPDRKLYVEIDGSVHRLRKERDDRRTAMLAERGWTGLRLPASLVASDVDAAVHRIQSWLADMVS